MDKSVFIVTHQRGFESDPVIDKLRDRGVSVFRFNTDAGEDKSMASFLSSGRMKFVCDNRSIVESEISVGWCQQLPPYRGQAGNQQESLQRRNLFTLQMAAFDHLGISWLNHPRRVMKASNKVNQLVAARKIGLEMPETLVSNDPESIRSFADGQEVVAKNLATPWVVSEGETKAAFTKIVDSSWLSNDAALSFAPVIYQKFYERSKDYRVVMVGEESFAASCEPNDYQREDIRRGAATGDNYSACEFDKKYLSKLRLLMDEFGINYCSADFMQDKAGDMYFLDLNTCGAWWWVDRFYDGAICESITKKLNSLANNSEGRQ